MKNHKLSKILTGACLLTSLSATATLAAPVGTAVEYKQKNDRFYLTITQNYAPGVTIEQVRNLFVDSSVLPRVSNLITKVERIPQVEPGHFQLLSTATKFMISLTTVNVCTETVSATQWKQSCRLDAGNSTNQRLFTGGEGSNVTTCNDQGGQVTCVNQINGRPKAMHFPLSRTPERLGAAGAVETTHDMGSILIYGGGGVSTGTARAQYESSNMPELLQKLYDTVTVYGAPDSLGDRVLDVKLSGLDGSFATEYRSGL